MGSDLIIQRAIKLDFYFYINQLVWILAFPIDGSRHKQVMVTNL